MDNKEELLAKIDALKKENAALYDIIETNLNERKIKVELYSSFRQKIEKRNLLLSLKEKLTSYLEKNEEEIKEIFKERDEFKKEIISIEEMLK